MAGGDDQSEEKTERATDHKLKKAREKGNIATSKDAVGLAGFTCVILYLGFMMPSIMERLIEPLIMISSSIGRPEGPDLLSAFVSVSVGVAMVVVPIVVLVMFTGFVTSAAVNKGFVFAAEKLKPEFKKFNPVTNAKEKFKRRNITEFVKVVLNMLVVMVIFGVTMYLMGGELLLSGICGLDCGIGVTVTILKLAVIVTLIYLILVAALDIRLQQALFMHDQRMTKTELKREHKEQEGDPLIKNARRNIGQQIVSETLASAMQNTVIVLTDPHNEIAVGVWHPGGRDILARGVVTMATRGKNAQAFVAMAQQSSKIIRASAALANKLSGSLPMQQIVNEDVNASIFATLRPYGYTG